MQEAAAMGERLAAALAEVQLREQGIADLQKKVRRPRDTLGISPKLTP